MSERGKSCRCGEETILNRMYDLCDGRLQRYWFVVWFLHKGAEWPRPVNDI